MTRKFGVFGFPGYVYIYYDSIYDATLHTPFSDPDGLPKKGPQICSPNSGEGCMDAETG